MTTKTSIIQLNLWSVSGTWSEITKLAGGYKTNDQGQCVPAHDGNYISRFKADHYISKMFRAIDFKDALAQARISLDWEINAAQEVTGSEHMGGANYQTTGESFKLFETSIYSKDKNEVIEAIEASKREAQPDLVEDLKNLQVTTKSSQNGVVSYILMYSESEIKTCNIPAYKNIETGVISTHFSLVDHLPQIIEAINTDSTKQCGSRDKATEPSGKAYNTPHHLDYYKDWEYLGTFNGKDFYYIDKGNSTGDQYYNINLSIVFGEEPCEYISPCFHNLLTNMQWYLFEANRSADYRIMIGLLVATPLYEKYRKVLIKDDKLTKSLGYAEDNARYQILENKRLRAQIKEFEEKA
jgi:hypothetical protein